MNTVNIREVLEKKLISFDGGMGSMLMAQGLAAGQHGELWNIDEPDKVLSVQKAYAEAGCDIINANTFSANSLKMKDAGHPLDEIIKAGLVIAHKALREGRSEADREERGDGWVALDIGPLGQFLDPYGDLEYDEAVAIFAEMIKAGTDPDNGEDGADIVLIETMMDVEEAKAAIQAAKENCDLPVFCTFTVDKTGHTLMGAGLKEIAEEMEASGVSAFGLNCGLGPDVMLSFLKELKTYTDMPVIIVPNAGLPRVENGETVYDVHPDEFADAMSEIAAAGADVIGGCCGTTPDHMHAALAKIR